MARGADPKQRCLDLKTELEQNYKVREEHIQNCVSVMEEKVNEKGRDKADVRQDQVKLRAYKSELDIEEIVKHRTEQIFSVCRSRSTKSLPFYLILTTCVVTGLWSTYGRIIGDSFVMVPNSLGFLAATFQLGLFAYFPAPPSEYK